MNFFFLFFRVNLKELQNHACQDLPALTLLLIDFFQLNFYFCGLKKYIYIYIYIWKVFSF